MREQYRPRDKLLIAGIDPLERLKGIPLKLRAIEGFLHKYPDMVHKIRVVQVSELFNFSLLAIHLIHRSAFETFTIVIPRRPMNVELRYGISWNGLTRDFKLKVRLFHSSSKMKHRLRPEFHCGILQILWYGPTPASVLCSRNYIR